MNICMIMSTPFPPEEGIGNYVYGLSSKLINLGHKVTIITRGNLFKTRREFIDDICVIKPPFFPLYPFHIQFHGLFLNRIFKKMGEEFDIVHIHSPLSPLISTSLPIIATIHTPMLIDTKKRTDETKDIRARIEQLIGRYISFHIEMDLIERANKITTVAHSVAMELREYGLNSKDVEVIGNGVDEKIFTPIKNKVDEKYILYSGRLDYRKGLFDLIESSKIICQVHPELSFVITGKGILVDKLKRRVNESGLKNNFNFVGFVSREKLIQLYQQATIYVLPSHYEGLPTVLLEAMACGCPVVATSVSGNLDVLTQDHDGILVPPKSPDKIAEAVLKLLDDEKMMNTLGINARNTIENRFTWSIISKKFLHFYNSLI